MTPVATPAEALARETHCLTCGRELQGRKQVRFCSRQCHNRKIQGSVYDRFLAKVQVQEAGCWLWQARTNWQGYGEFFLVPSWSKESWRAHRVSYFLFVGEIPHGLSVLHRCDVPACVNPAHLFLGTNRDNMADMDAKSRRKPSPGEMNGRAKVKLADVMVLRHLYATRQHRLKDLAKRFGISIRQASNIVRRVSWKDA